MKKTYLIKDQGKGLVGNITPDKLFDIAGSGSNNGDNPTVEEQQFENINGSNLSVFDCLVRLDNQTYKNTVEYFYYYCGIESINHNDVLDVIINNFSNGSAYADIYQQSTIAMNDFEGQTEEFIVKYLFEFFCCCYHFYEESTIPDTIENFLIFNSDDTFSDKSISNFLYYLDFVKSSQLKQKAESYNASTVEELYTYLVLDIEYIIGEFIPESIKPKDNKSIMSPNIPTHNDEVVNLGFFSKYIKKKIDDSAKNFIPWTGSKDGYGNVKYLKGEFEYSGDILHNKTVTAENYANLVSSFSSITTSINGLFNSESGFGSIIGIQNESSLPENERKGLYSSAEMKVGDVFFKLSSKYNVHDQTEQILNNKIRLDLVCNTNSFRTFVGFSLPKYEFMSDAETPLTEDWVVQKHHLQRAIDYSENEIKTGAYLIDESGVRKPLYRKLIKLYQSQINNISLLSLIPDLENIIKVDSTLQYNNNTYSGPIFMGVNSLNIILKLNKTGNIELRDLSSPETLINISTLPSPETILLNLIIEYTK